MSKKSEEFVELLLFGLVSATIGVAMSVLTWSTMDAMAQKAKSLTDLVVGTAIMTTISSVSIITVVLGMADFITKRRSENFTT